jgi:predicted PurR-regulated permease PerM
MKALGPKNQLNDHHKTNPPNNQIIFFGTEFQVFKVILVLSILALTTLFLPFAKSAILAIVFSLAITGAVDKLNHLSKNKRILFFTTMVIALLGLILALISMIDMIFNTIISTSDPVALSKLKLKFLELFLPTIEILKKYLSLILYQIDKTSTIETRLANSTNQAFDALFSYSVEWFSEVPNNVLQFFFFIFLMIFLIRKINYLNRTEEILLYDKKSSILMFLIFTAKKSGYNAIVTTILTALAQATLMTIGSIAIGIISWPIVFIASFISAMIPVFGILPVAVACSIYAGSVFNIQKAVIVALFGVASSVIDNILRPLLMAGDDSTLNPILCFFALIGSIFVFGFSGLFIGPFVLLFTSSVFKRYQIKKITGIKISEKS